MSNLMTLFSLYLYGIAAFKTYNNSMVKFKKLLNQSKHVLVITGAGISVESGIPLFQGVNAYFKKKDVRLLRTETSFKENPSMVWEFFHYQREVAIRTKPNPAHYALVEFEKRCQKEGRQFTLITQNIDGLHKKAGSKNLIELYGSLFRTKCTVCGDVSRNFKSPICRGLKRRGKPNATGSRPVALSKLPRCQKEECYGLLRPYVVFFGEEVDPRVGKNVDETLKNCDLCLIIGSSSAFVPMTEFTNRLIWNRIPIAEFNTASTVNTALYQFHFQGSCIQTVPEALSVW